VLSAGRTWPCTPNQTPRQEPDGNESCRGAMTAERAEDVTSETFEGVLRGLPAYRPA
jgi:hypothetical protein